MSCQLVFIWTSELTSAGGCTCMCICLQLRCVCGFPAVVSALHPPLLYPRWLCLYVRSCKSVCMSTCLSVYFAVRWVTHHYPHTHTRTHARQRMLCYKSLIINLDSRCRLMATVGNRVCVCVCAVCLCVLYAFVWYA